MLLVVYSCGCLWRLARHKGHGAFERSLQPFSLMMLLFVLLLSTLEAAGARVLEIQTVGSLGLCQAAMFVSKLLLLGDWNHVRWRHLCPISDLWVVGVLLGSTICVRA